MKARWPLLLALTLVVGAHLRDRFDAWVDTTRLPPLLAETSVEVLDRDGVLLRAYTVENGRWRFDVTPAQVDQTYLDMLMRYEDKRFRSHGGVDPVALARAAAQALWHGRVVSGGSTLTMQVARLLENSGTGRVPGKLRQIRLAFALERRLTKDQILALYLIHAPFGGNLEGIRAASRAYFGKPPRHLSIAEAALLVALPQSPERRRPDLNPQAAAVASAAVLNRMVRAGAMPQADADRAVASRLPKTRRPFPMSAPHVADRIRAKAPLQHTHHLTLSADLQTWVQARVTASAKSAGRGLSAAALVVDHQTGEVIVSIGSTGLSEAAGHLDMTRALRSPGSTLKPLVYALAYDTGRAHPLSLISDAPIRFGTYAPENFDGLFRGDITLDAALQLSLNTPVVQLTEMITPARLVAAMRTAGMEPELNGSAPGLAVSLGGVGVTLEGLVRLYAGIAQGGRQVVPAYTQNGLYSGEKRKFASRKSAWQVSNTLSRIPPPPGMPRDLLAYKTGTSYGHRDTWAIGFDGRHVIGIWLGRPDGTAVPGIFGADLAAPLLFDVAQIIKPKPDPLPHAPADISAWSSADLPEHLKRVGRSAGGNKQSLTLAFPPDGARLTQENLTLKLSHGQPPFSVLLNGNPIAKPSRDRAISVKLDGPGFHRVTAMDAQGRSASVNVELR